MADTNDLVRDYLKNTNVMQLATSVNDIPWACTVHFYSDDQINIYWLSKLDRQHSQHIEANPNVAVTVMVHENTQDENYVIGISIAGTAELVDGLPDDAVVKGFTLKHDQAPELGQDIVSGKNPHRFYRLKPGTVVLFDSFNFPDEPRQTIKIED